MGRCWSLSRVRLSDAGVHESDGIAELDLTGCVDTLTGDRAGVAQVRDGAVVRVPLIGSDSESEAELVLSTNRTARVFLWHVEPHHDLDSIVSGGEGEGAPAEVDIDAGHASRHDRLASENAIVGDSDLVDALGRGLCVPGHSSPVDDLVFEAGLEAVVRDQEPGVSTRHNTVHDERERLQGERAVIHDRDLDDWIRHLTGERLIYRYEGGVAVAIDGFDAIRVRKADRVAVTVPSVHDDRVLVAEHGEHAGGASRDRVIESAEVELAIRIGHACRADLGRAVDQRAGVYDGVEVTAIPPVPDVADADGWQSVHQEVARTARGEGDGDRSYIRLMFHDRRRSDGRAESDVELGSRDREWVTWDLDVSVDLHGQCVAVLVEDAYVACGEETAVLACRDHVALSHEWA